MAQAPKQISDGYHMALSIGRAMFSELLATSLPVTVKDGDFDLVKNARDLARQLQVKEKVRGLLDNGSAPNALVKVKEKASEVWDGRRDQIYELINDLLSVEGTWKVEVDREGSEFIYGSQEIGAQAFFKFSAAGKATLLKQNLEIPFDLSKRLGAEVHLKEIHYDRETGQLQGNLKGVTIRFGDHPLWRYVDDMAQKLIDQQIVRFNPVPILKKQQLDDMLGGEKGLGPLKIKMEVDDLALEIGEEYMTLKVRFGFSQLQIALDPR
jgi:hypothetical protein